METIASVMPVWVFALLAFGLQFWLFCLLPNWINRDADVIDAADNAREGEPAVEYARNRNHSP